MTPSPNSLPTRPQSPRVLPSGCQDICSRLPDVQLVLFCRLSRVHLLRRIRRRELASGPRGCCSISRMSGSCTVFCFVVTPQNSWDSHVCNESLYGGEDGGRTLVAGVLGTLESRGAVHKHNDLLPHSPAKCRVRTRGVNVYQLHRPLGARRRVMGS